MTTEIGYPLARDIALPRRRIVSGYTFERLGLDVGFRCHYAESVPIRDPGSFTITEASAVDGAFTQLVIPEWLDTDPVGRVGEILGVADFGRVLAWDNTTTTATVESGLAADPTGRRVRLYMPSAFGGVMGEKARYGREWSIWLPANEPAVLLYLFQKLGGAHGEVVATTLQYLQGAPSPETIGAAIQAMAAVGINMETILSRVVRTIDSDREMGLLPAGAQVAGEAPDPYEILDA
jgi:hypothetical protein